MAAKTFTFKKEAKATGLARVAQTRSTYIKLGNKWVGTIYPPTRDNGFVPAEPQWTIQLRVVDASARGGWKNARLKWRGNSEDEAKQFLVNHFDVIVANGLYTEEGGE